MLSPRPTPPAAFRRLRVLIVGCGDVGRRVARLLAPRVRLRALTSRPEAAESLRALGITPLAGNLDQPASLHRLAGLGSHVLHLAPPPSGPGAGLADPRTAALLRALARRGPVRALAYGSTTGVYGDAGGARFDETRPVAPANDRAHRRVHAEQLVRAFGRRHGVRTAVLRIPGIYAPDRAGGARERLLKGTPVLRAEDDVHTNHIHADDLARACLRALFLGRPQRVVHASDDTELRMGDYLDLAADLYGLPRPPRVSRQEAAGVFSPLQLSFMNESRRLDNTRLKRELHLVLRHPTVAQGLLSGHPGGGAAGAGS